MDTAWPKLSPDTPSAPIRFDVYTHWPSSLTKIIAAQYITETPNAVGGFAGKTVDCAVNALVARPPLHRRHDDKVYERRIAYLHLRAYMVSRA